MDERIFLTQQELATRWRVSARTLEGWRLKGIGPRYVKIGSRVRYRLRDVVQLEDGAVLDPGG